ncbi:MAG TPA: 30S ribosomal protein S8e [Candidatus Micrarchaeota archaeon]|nr:30S ribosomal protein S8e [Candidatus Micrarchaeota archaeon]
MEQYHGRKGTKTNGTGGKRHRSADKKLSLMGSPFTATKLGDKQVKVLLAGRGSTFKIKLKRATFVNVVTKDGIKKAKIRNVTESPANRNYARQNIISKGTIVDTELGKVKVTNRVGQDGVVNGILA